jgi:tetrahydromethanopterin S-methyltransferase subunit G
MGKTLNKLKYKIKHAKYSPLRLLEKEERKTMYEATHGEYKKEMTRKEALYVSIAALLSAFISVYIRIIYIIRFSHFESNEIMESWHPLAAPLKITGILLYLYCMDRKGIYYWLIWYGAIVGLIYFTIEALLVHNILDVSTLAGFFKAIGLWDLPEWIIGKL